MISEKFFFESVHHDKHESFSIFQIFMHEKSQAKILLKVFFQKVLILKQNNVAK